MPAASNTFVSSSILSRFGAKALRNKTVVYSRVRTDVSDAYKVAGYKSGDTITVKLPPRYTSSTGAAINKQNTVQSTVSLTLVQRNIAIGATSLPRTVTIDGMTQFMEPIMAQLATDMDRTGLDVLYYGAENLVTPGAISATTGPAAFTGADLSTKGVLGQAAARLTEKALPDDGERFGALTPSAMANITDANSTLFNPAGDIASQYRTGLLGMYNGIQWVQSAVLPRHTNGTRDNTTPLVNGASQSGSSLVLDGLDASVTINKGDMFVIAGVEAINPLTRTSTGKLQVFTVTANATASGAGAVTLSIAPAISVTAPNQTVSALPANDAVVTFMGGASVASDVNLAWHREAAVGVMLPLETDFPGAEASLATDPESGMIVRVMKQGDIETDEVVYRADILFGFAKVRGEGIVRLQG